MLDTAIIIAGGKSTRMGYDKAFIRINGKIAIERQVKILKRVFKELIIVARNKEDFEFLNVRVVEDVYKNIGPIAGLHAGLKNTSNQYCYLIACDMPFLCYDLVVHMRKLLKEKPDIIACENKNFIEPFHGVYSRKLIPNIEKQIIENKYSIFHLMKASKIQIVNNRTIKYLCNGMPIFTNINTKKDLIELSEYIKHSSIEDFDV